MLLQVAFIRCGGCWCSFSPISRNLLGKLFYRFRISSNILVSQRTLGYHKLLNFSVDLFSSYTESSVGSGPECTVYQISQLLTILTDSRSFFTVLPTSGSGSISFTPHRLRRECPLFGHLPANSLYLWQSSDFYSSGVSLGTFSDCSRYFKFSLGAYFQHLL